MFGWITNGKVSFWIQVQISGTIAFRSIPRKLKLLRRLSRLWLLKPLKWFRRWVTSILLTLLWFQVPMCPLLTGIFLVEKTDFLRLVKSRCILLIIIKVIRILNFQLLHYVQNRSLISINLRWATRTFHFLILIT